MRSIAPPHIGLFWKVRRVAAGLRQVDIAACTGITATRLSAIERGELEPSALDRRLIERELPPLQARLLEPQVTCDFEAEAEMNLLAKDLAMFQRLGRLH